MASGFFRASHPQEGSVIVKANVRIASSVEFVAESVLRTPHLRNPATGRSFTLYTLLTPP